MPHIEFIAACFMLLLITQFLGYHHPFALIHLTPSNPRIFYFLISHLYVSFKAFSFAVFFWFHNSNEASHIKYPKAFSFQLGCLPGGGGSHPPQNTTICFVVYFLFLRRFRMVYCWVPVSIFYYISCARIWWWFI